MRLHDIKPVKGSVKAGRRIGRGEGSGSGDTAGRGHNGAKSRSGYSKKQGFEGGQMPLQRRVPKFGFFSRNRIEYRVFNLDRLSEIAEANKVDSITPAFLEEKNIIRNGELIKILGNGELSAKLTVEAHKFSKTAKTAIEEKGGEAKTL